MQGCFWGSVEETLNAIFIAYSEGLVGRCRFESTATRRDIRSGSHQGKLQTRTIEARLNVYSGSGAAVAMTVRRGLPLGVEQICSAERPTFGVR